MYRIDLPIDAKEAAVISRRRRAEEERKLRIFNPRERIYGKDLRALEEQIEEKKQREQRSKELEEAWLRERQRQQLLAQELERREKEDKLRVWQDLQEFRKHCQRFEDRKEFDLNDKRKCEYAARLHDEDVRNGPASMQKFDGEDLSYRQRIVNQEQQKRFWLDAQIAEKKQNTREFEEANQMYEQRLREMGLRSMDLRRAEEAARRAVDQAYREYNRALAMENAEKKKLERLADEEATLAHQLNCFHSELLTEVTDATSINRPFGITRDRFKGYTEEMIKTIKEEQRRQIMEKKQREAEENCHDVAWEKQSKRHALAVRMLDMQLDQRKREDHLRLIKENKNLAEEQQTRQCYINKMMYRGNFTDEFFEQFNTSTR